MTQKRFIIWIFITNNSNLIFPPCELHIAEKLEFLVMYTQFHKINFLKISCLYKFYSSKNTPNSHNMKVSEIHKKSF